MITGNYEYFYCSFDAFTGKPYTFRMIESYVGILHTFTLQCIASKVSNPLYGGTKVKSRDGECVEGLNVKTCVRCKDVSLCDQQQLCYKISISMCLIFKKVYLYV